MEVYSPRPCGVLSLIHMLATLWKLPKVSQCLHVFNIAINARGNHAVFYKSSNCMEFGVRSYIRDKGRPVIDKKR